MDPPSPTPTGSPDVTEDEIYSSWSLFIVCMLMILALWTSYYLQIRRIRAIHETLVSIFAGMLVGFVVRIAPGTLIRDMLHFKHTLFFNLLLPPIILASGYELRQENFFRNFGSILIFAFLGTFISAVGIGILVYIYSSLGLENLSLSVLECLIFGSTLSATDPVTILAIFNQLKVDPKLYSIIFGESLLNDAVSIVMYETLSKFDGKEHVYISSFFHGIGIFLWAFTASMALGVAFGLFMSLVLKHSSLNLYPQIETCLVALIAYTSYFLSNGLEISGIVSLLFCGITLKHYAYHTMSRRTQRATRYIFATLARLTENFIFIYLGLSLFTSAPSDESVGSYIKPLLVVITTVSVIFTRYAAVFPLSEAINFFHRHIRQQRNEELPHSYQMMLFWAGLRGAVGVALASGFKGQNAQVLRMTVLMVVVLTVLIFGGTTARMLEVLNIRLGVDDGGATDSEDEQSPVVVRSSARFGNGYGGGVVYDYEDGEEEGGRYGDVRFNHHERNPKSPVHSGSHAPPPNNGHPFMETMDDEESDAGEVLPMVPTSPPSTAAPGGAPPAGMTIGDDGKWFQALDERYLLPLFSNATASRTHQAKKARKTSAAEAGGSSPQSPGDSDDDGDDEGGGSGDISNPSPARFSRSVSDLFGHLRRGVGASSSSPKREEEEPLVRGSGPSTPRIDIPQQQPQQTFNDISRQNRGLTSPVLRTGSLGDRIPPS